MTEKSAQSSTVSLLYVLAPLLVVLAAASLACIAGYFIFQGMNGALSLSKIVNKATQVFLVLSIFPAMAYLKFNGRDLGFAPKTVFLKQLFLGFGLGFITLMPVFIVQYALGINVLDQSHKWTAGLVAEQMLVSLLLALLISMIEEPLFRGILFAGLKKKLPIIAVILISSVYYAALHFLNSKIELPLQQVQLFSGFPLLIDAFANLLNREILSAFLALLMVGIFLGVLRTLVPEGLGLCIGCHTCWVWQIKMNKNLFNTDLNSEYGYLVSSYDGVVGPLVSIWLGLSIISYFVYKRIRG